MHEIKCPKCGEKFEIDESSYATIANQVRNEEFEQRIREKEEQFEADKLYAVQKAKLDLQMEIHKLNMAIEANETKNKLAIAEAVQQKEKEISEKAHEIAILKGQMETAEDRKSVVRERVCQLV